jgi:hypothetical protein
MGCLPLLALLAACEGLLPAAWRLAWRVAAIRPPILSVGRWLAIVGAVRWSGRLLAGDDRSDVWSEEAAWRWPVRSGSRAGGLASGLRAGLFRRLSLRARLLL